MEWDGSSVFDYTILLCLSFEQILQVSVLFEFRECSANCKTRFRKQGKRARRHGARCRAGRGLFVFHLQGRPFTSMSIDYARCGGEHVDC